MVNYCKLCGADLTPAKEFKLMTWEEFVDWAKELNAEITERYDQRCLQCEYCGKFYIEEDSNADEDRALYCSSECFWGAEKEYKERHRDIFHHDYWINK